MNKTKSRTILTHFSVTVSPFTDNLESKMLGGDIVVVSLPKMA